MSSLMHFKKTVLDYYRKHGRHALPWRKRYDPYAIVVSEFMLQQTQVERVVPFFKAFVKRFSSWEKLARARRPSVLKAWQGLGYNRRALSLQRCAKMVVEQYEGVLPDSYEELVALPGIGPYTAAAVMAFAFDKPHTMIETNIRRVYIHHFFREKKQVDDALLIPFIEKTMDREQPRRWFSALMDYGSWLAEQEENPNRRSKQYVRQSTFEGSDRQIRGAMLRDILRFKSISEPAFRKRYDIPYQRFKSILSGLEREGFIMRTDNTLRCA